MEGLLGLFDVVAGVGELLGRKEEKDQELTALAKSVESISQSVRTFAVSMCAEEREDAFKSNSVFSELVQHLTVCNEIIARHRLRVKEQERLSLENGEADTSRLRVIRRSLVEQGSRTFREGLEALSTRLGAFGGIALPEDELDLMRKAGKELERLVPQLTLAISVYLTRGRKRSLEPDAVAVTQPPQDRWRRSLTADKVAIIETRGADLPAYDCPPLQLKLVSEHPSARTCSPLPTLTAADLRPVGPSSNSSLDSASAADAAAFLRLVFGRQEVKDKVPKTLTLPDGRGGAGQPLWRFVSRELLALDVPLPKAAEEPEDSLNMATLDFGGHGSASDDLMGATLSWGDADAIADPAPAMKWLPPTLAEVLALTQSGMHLRPAGEACWKWTAKDAKTSVKQGDCIAILLESPPGSATPGPQRDLELSEATCLLGVELLPPKAA